MFFGRRSYYGFGGRRKKKDYSFWEEKMGYPSVLRWCFSRGGGQSGAIGLSSWAEKKALPLGKELPFLLRKG